MINHATNIPFEQRLCEMGESKSQGFVSNYISQENM